MTDQDITIILTVADAYALAQFVKRCCYSDYREKSTSDEQAHDIGSAMYQLQKALAEAGYNPR